MTYSSTRKKRMPSFRPLAVAVLVLGLRGHAAAQALAAPPPDSDRPAIARGPFKPTLESLNQYPYPEWFRDAKLGIWAHWGPQAVPMFGDWYARHLYVQGHPQYKDHLEHYGHPSKLGHKDIIPLTLLADAADLNGDQIKKEKRP